MLKFKLKVDHDVRDVRRRTRSLTLAFAVFFLVGTVQAASQKIRALLEEKTMSNKMRAVSVGCVGIVCSNLVVHASTSSITCK